MDVSVQTHPGGFVVSATKVPGGWGSRVAGGHGVPGFTGGWGSRGAGSQGGHGATGGWGSQVSGGHGGLGFRELAIRGRPTMTGCD